MKILFSRICILIVFQIVSVSGFTQKNASREIYELVVYKMKTTAQIAATDLYLKDAYLPAMHRLGIKQIGVFKPITNDTAAVKEIIVLTPYISLEVWKRTKSNILLDESFQNTSKAFAYADTSQVPFSRMESSIMEAFPNQTRIIPTPLASNPDAIYELRSYESPTEELHRIKVNMFNAGGEVALFKRLDFQAVFYADVLSGSHMPNLVYMVAFTSMNERQEHWKSFVNSDEWKNLIADPQYRNDISVNHIDSKLMHRTPYSDL